jgi:hypothetical protein
MPTSSARGARLATIESARIESTNLKREIGEAWRRASRLVANALLSLGFSNVRVFMGGWEEWSKARLPKSTGSGQ